MGRTFERVVAGPSSGRRKAPFRDPTGSSRLAGGPGQPRGEGKGDEPLPSLPSTLKCPAPVLGPTNSPLSGTDVPSREGEGAPLDRGSRARISSRITTVIRVGALAGSTSPGTIERTMTGLMSRPQSRRTRRLELRHAWLNL